MKFYRKSTLAVAVSAAIGAAAVVPMAHSTSIDVGPGGGIRSDSRGDTLLFPIYTTAVGAQTSFSTTNTSNSTVAAKIRFREQDHSMDVLDFIVVYSPYDKFDFSLSQAEGETRPVMRWTDTTCVIGPDAGGAQAFPAPSSFVDSEEQMPVGHAEILAMANLDQICWNATTNEASLAGPNRACASGFVNLGEQAIHDDDDVPANCALLTSVLSNPASVAAVNQEFGATAQQFLLRGNRRLNGQPLAYDAPNALLGRYVITDAAGGIEAGGDAIAIQNSNFMLSAQSGADCADQGSQNCLRGYNWDAKEFDHPHFGDMSGGPFGVAGLTAFQLLLSGSAAAGDWSNNPENFVGVDWIISFPSKYAYLGNGEEDCGDAENDDGWCLLAETRPRNAFPPQSPRPGIPAVWTTSDTDDLCLTDAELYVWDAEENQSGTTVTVSPGDQTQLDLCPELGVYTFAPQGDVDPRTSVIQTADRREIIRFENLDAIRGWARLGIPWATNGVGGAVNGLNFTTRATADPTFNNGSLTTLQKFDFSGF